MELVAFVGGSLHRTLREIEHNANRLIFLKETYIKVTDDVYILESLDRELSARKGDYQTTKPEETMTLIRNEMAGNCAARFNKGKPQLTFNVLGAEVQKLEADVWAFGAKKYAAGNWLKGCSVMKSADSLQRHLTAYLNGEDIDSETQLSTLGHIICSAKILAQGHIMGFDDRPEEVNRNEKKGL